MASLAAARLTLSSPRRKPNFLFILADDHAGYVMGCDGDSQAFTRTSIRNVGRVLDALRRLHLEEDTLVIYTADRG